MDNKIKTLLSVIILQSLMACTSKDFYEGTNELWCNYKHDSQSSHGNEINPGEQRNASAQVPNCTYKSHEEYQKQKDELEKAVAAQKKKDNM